MLEFLCKKKVSVCLVYHLRILRDAIIAVAVVSLIRIVREGKHDAYLFIGKGYIQLVNFVTELVPQNICGLELKCIISVKICQNTTTYDELQ